MATDKGQDRPMLDERDVEKFMARVSMPNGEYGCWLWKGGPAGGNGYGGFYAKGEHWRAHRVAYELAWGRPHDGLHVLHSCDNRRCVNGLHLRLGTNSDNVRDRLERGRGSRNDGEFNPNVKLSNDQCRAILARADGGEKPSSIHRSYPQVTCAAIRRVIRTRRGES